MTRLDEIKTRLEAFETLTFSDYGENDMLDPPFATDFWENVEDDLAWCVEELAKFHLCGESVDTPDGSKCYMDYHAHAVYHKEGE